MNVEKIEKLEDIVALDDNKTIIDHQVKRLTAAGENYGSLMLSVDITVQTPLGTEEMRTVAKMVPPNEFIQKIFNTQTSFKNEIAFYNNIVPVLQEFQREQGMDKLIDFFPKYYGSRINLSGDPSLVDSDAILLLENLKLAGYKNIERTLGFDLETSKLIIEDLAHLHAVPLGLKLKKPDLFENEVKKYLTPFRPPDGPGDFQKRFFAIIDKIDELRIFKKRIQKPFDNHTINTEVREPFATVQHNDCWVNNTMVKMERGKPVNNKLVDFQICDYASPAKDLVFFLFSSVQNNILEKHYDALVRYYHQTFISILQELKCDTTRFSFNAFLKEINFEANSEFLHLMFMTFVIFARKGTVKELSEITPDDMFSGSLDITDAHKEKLILIIRQFAKRNWI